MATCGITALRRRKDMAIMKSLSPGQVVRYKPDQITFRARVCGFGVTRVQIEVFEAIDDGGTVLPGLMDEPWRAWVAPRNLTIESEADDA